jgi:hypothetical protein
VTQRQRKVIGILGTVGWAAAGLALLYWKRLEIAQMHPADWGNFLSGFVAPLAFLWFLLSYLQQGDELRLNTESSS